MKPHLLYVEDDESLSFVTRDNLELKGYQITHCLSGKEAADLIQESSFDLCILDVMLPEMDGFELASLIREKDKEVPIIFLTAKSLKEDKIHGLRLGADDYITKPFSIEELILKIEVFLRRSKINYRVKQDQFQIGQFHLDYPNLQLQIGEDGRRLTQKEADLLKYFYENANQVVKRSNHGNHF